MTVINENMDKLTLEFNTLEEVNDKYNELYKNNLIRELR